MSRRRYTPLAICACLVLLAGACGNSGDGEGEAGETTVPPTTIEDTPVEKTETNTPSTTRADTSTGTVTTTTETAPDNPEIDPYPHRDDFVALEDVPGVSDDEIAVAVIGTQQGNPLGTCILDCYVTGIRAYFDYVNDAGGIYGRRLVIEEVLDDNLFGNKDHALKVIADGNSLAVFQATLVASGWGDLDDADIPTFVWNIHGTEAVNRDAIFGNFVVGCTTCTNRWLPWLVSQADAGRVAALGYGISENSKVCSRSLADSIDLYSAELGIEVAYFNDNLAYGLPNGIGPEVTQMIEADVDFIASCMDLNAMLTLAQELQRQGVRDQVTMYHPNSYDTGFVESAGDLFDGDYVSLLFAAFEYEVDTPLRHAYNQWVPADGGPVAEQTIAGWINADLFVTGLLEAGPAFDRQSVIDGINTNQTSYSAAGLITPIDWSRQHTAVVEGVADHDYELECVSAVRIQDGGFVGFQPEPWMCWPSGTQGWSEPVPTDFAG